MGQDKKINRKPIIENRQAKFNYELGENFEAGISLLGWEVKSIRSSRVDTVSYTHLTLPTIYSV